MIVSKLKLVPKNAYLLTCKIIPRLLSKPGFWVFWATNAYFWPSSTVFEEVFPNGNRFDN